MTNNTLVKPVAPTRNPIVWVVLGVVIVLLAIFPPLRFHKLRSEGQPAAAISGGPVAAETLWQEKIIPAVANASDVKQLIANPEAARRSGHVPDVGGPSFLFVHGAGTLVSREGAINRIAVTDASTPQITISTGPVFGTTVRDGSGVMHAGDFTNSADFNTLSRGLNQIVSQRVLPVVAGAPIGSKLKFAGMVEMDSDSTKPPFALVPVSVEVQK